MIYSEKFLENENSVFNHLPILEDFNIIQPEDIPIVENIRLNTNIVRYSDLYKYAESQNYTFREAYNHLKAFNNTDNIVVSIDESLIFDYPDLIATFENNVVINPVNTNTVLYKLCEECMYFYLETGDISYIDYFLEADDQALKDYQMKLARQQSAFNQAQSELSQLKQNDPKYKTGNQRLMGMQKGIENTKKMIAELEKRGSKNTLTIDDRKQAIEAGKNTANTMVNSNNPSNRSPSNTNSTGSSIGDKVSTVVDTLKNMINTNSDNNNQNNNVQNQSWFQQIIQRIRDFFTKNSNNNSTATQEATMRIASTPMGRGGRKNITNITQIPNNNQNMKSYQGITGRNYAPIPQSKQQLDQPNSLDQKTQQSISEVYRPRRKYHHRYLR